MALKDYDNELLHLAHDLAVRLLPAFENTGTGIPFPRVRSMRLLWMLPGHTKAEGEISVPWKSTRTLTLLTVVFCL